MIDDDEDGAPIGATTITLPHNLTALSIDALHEYIAVLEAEIERVRQDIDAKQGVRSEAEKFFRSND